MTEPLLTICSEIEQLLTELAAARCGLTDTENNVQHKERDLFEERRRAEVFNKEILLLLYSVNDAVFTVGRETRWGGRPRQTSGSTATGGYERVSFKVVAGPWHLSG